MSSLSHTSEDVIVAMLGRGSLLAKMDIKQAYRMVPLHPDDRVFARHAVGERCLRRQGPPIWLKVSPINFLSSSRCAAIYDAEKWCNVCGPLYHHRGSPQFREMCE